MPQHTFERIRFEDDGECWLIQYAIDGQRAPAFWLHKSYRPLLTTNPTEFWAVCERGALSSLQSMTQHPDLCEGVL